MGFTNVTLVAALVLLAFGCGGGSSTDADDAPTDDGGSDSGEVTATTVEAGADTATSPATSAPATTTIATTAPTIAPTSVPEPSATAAEPTPPPTSGPPDRSWPAIPTGSVAVDPSTDLLVAHRDGDVYLHPGALGNDPGPPRAVVDRVAPTPSATGSGTSTVSGVAGVADGSVVFGDCCEPPPGNLFASPGVEGPVADLGDGFAGAFNPSGDRLAAVGDAVSVLDADAEEWRSAMLRDTAAAAHLEAASLGWTTDDSLVVVAASEGSSVLIPVEVGDDRVAIGDPTPLAGGAATSFSFAGLAGNGDLALAARGDDFVEVRFYDAITLEERGSAWPLPAGATGVRLGLDGTALLWTEDDKLIHLPIGGDGAVAVADDVVAGWFVRDV